MNLYYLQGTGVAGEESSHIFQFEQISEIPEIEYQFPSYPKIGSQCILDGL